MKFIKPKEWITPQANRAGIGDASPMLAHLGTFAQVVSYAAVSAVSALAARKK